MKANKQIRINAILKNRNIELNIRMNVSKENTELDPMVIILCKEDNDNLYDEYDKHMPTKDQLKTMGITDDDAGKLIRLSNYEYVDASTVQYKILDGIKENAKETLKKIIMMKGNDGSIPKHHILALASDRLSDVIDHKTYKTLTSDEKSLYETAVTNETVISNFKFIFEFISKYKKLLENLYMDIFIEATNSLEIKMSKNTNDNNIKVSVNEILISDEYLYRQANTIPFANLDVTTKYNFPVFEDTFANANTSEFLPKINNYTANYLRHPTEGTITYHIKLTDKTLNEQNALLVKAALNYEKNDSHGLTKDELKLLSYPKNIVTSDWREYTNYMKHNLYELIETTFTDKDLESLDLYVDSKKTVSLEKAISLMNTVVDSLAIDYSLDLSNWPEN